MEFLIYPICGAFAGFAGGLFGIGGGLIVVPVLSSVFAWLQLAPGHNMQMALGTSLFTILATSMSATLSHHRRLGVDWQIVRRLLPGIIVGTWLGAALADVLHTDQLRLGFGVAECALGVYMWSRRNVIATAAEQALGRLRLMLAGVGIGSISSLAGIGGGTLTVPYLVRSGVRMARAVGSSSACGVPIALFGSLAYLYWGWDTPDLPRHAWGYLYWPAALGIMLMAAATAPLGAALAHRLPDAVLKRGFAVLLFLMGAKMLFF